MLDKIERKKPELSKEFIEAWKAYPSRKGSKGNKPACARLYNKLLKAHSHCDVMTAINNYKDECIDRKIDGTGLVKQFSTWLIKGRLTNAIKAEKGKFLCVEHYLVKKETVSNEQKWNGLRYKVLKNSNGRCCLCGNSAANGAELHVDHIKPKSIHPELEFDINNLQVLCRECNLGKSNTDDTDWRA